MLDELTLLRAMNGIHGEDVVMAGKIYFSEKTRHRSRKRLLTLALAAALLLEAATAMRGNGAAPERRELAFGDLRVVSRASTRPLATHDPRVAEALLVIRREACAGLRPARVAALFPCSRRMADIRFRRATGRSIGEEIAAQRLEQVKRLLADPLRQIKVIGDFCGFADPASLRKFFRRETGMSLSAWRRVHCFPHSRKTR